MFEFMGRIARELDMNSSWYKPGWMGLPSFPEDTFCPSEFCNESLDNEGIHFSAVLLIKLLQKIMRDPQTRNWDVDRIFK